MSSRQLSKQRTDFGLSFSTICRQFLKSQFIFVHRYIKSLLPPTATLLDSFVTNVSFEFEASPGLIPSLFDNIGEFGSEHGIEDWGLSQTSLEEVFLRIISEEDADAD